MNAHDCEKSVTQLHLYDISRSCCKNWTWLGPHFKISETEIDDIKKNCGEEKDKRLQFFQLWSEKEGSDATYYKLIISLLKLEEKSNAEFVFQLLKDKLPTPLMDNKEFESVTDPVRVRGM